MKALQKRTARKKIILIAGALVLISAAAGAYFLWNRNQATTQDTTQKTDLEPATEEQINAGSNTKQQAVESQSKPNASQSDTPEAAGPTIAVTITAANQNGAILNVRALINELINDGTCTLTLTRTDSSSTVTKTAPVQALATTATCQGFDIPVSELSAGNWSLSLTVTSGSRTGSTTQDISIQ